MELFSPEICLCDLNIWLLDKLRMYHIYSTDVDICPISIGTQVYPLNLPDWVMRMKNSYLIACIISSGRWHAPHQGVRARECWHRASTAFSRRWYQPHKPRWLQCSSVDIQVYREGRHCWPTSHLRCPRYQPYNSQSASVIGLIITLASSNADGYKNSVAWKDSLAQCRWAWCKRLHCRQPAEEKRSRQHDG